MNDYTYIYLHIRIWYVSAYTLYVFYVSDPRLKKQTA